MLTSMTRGKYAVLVASLALLGACSDDASTVAGPEIRYGSGTYANSGQVNVCIAPGSPAGTYVFSTAGSDVNSVGIASEILMAGGSFPYSISSVEPACVTVFDRLNPAVVSLDQMATIKVSITPPQGVVLKGDPVCQRDPGTPVPADCSGTTVLVYAQHYHGIRVLFTFESIPTPAFVVGDTEPHGIGDVVNFWGPQWWRNNAVSGLVGNGVSGFKGDVTTAGNYCGGTWSTTTGNSAPPPPAIGQPVVVVVTDAVGKNGGTISGTIQKILLVNHDETYDHNVGHHGFGVVTTVLCEL